MIDFVSIGNSPAALASEPRTAPTVECVKSDMEVLSCKSASLGPKLSSALALPLDHMARGYLRPARELRSQYPPEVATAVDLE